MILRGVRSRNRLGGHACQSGVLAGWNRGRIWTVPPAASSPNPNSEGRNPKEGRIPKAEATLDHFGFRVWAFALMGWWCCPDTPWNRATLVEPWLPIAASAWHRSIMNPLLLKSRMPVQTVTYAGTCVLRVIASQTSKSNKHSQTILAPCRSWGFSARFCTRASLNSVVPHPRQLTETRIPGVVGDRCSTWRRSCRGRTNPKDSWLLCDHRRRPHYRFFHAELGQRDST